MSEEPELLLQPQHLPFHLDIPGGRLLLLRLSVRERAQAVFLDERVRPDMSSGAWVAWQAAQQVARRCADAPMRWIFHIGHCGSTLLSRLLETPTRQVLREPLPLRQLAAASATGACGEEDLAGYLQTLSRLWARPVDGCTSTLVKATSSCNALIGPLLATRSGDRIILLDMPLRPYLATLLKSPMSVQDALAGAGERWRTLRRMRPGTPMRAPQSAGEACAMGWLAEQLRFADIAGRDVRAMRVDFEQLLAQPRETLEGVCAHLAFGQGSFESAVSSPWWTRYAKAGNYAYGIEDRLHDQRLAMSRFTEEIERGVAWVRDASPSQAG